MWKNERIKEFKSYISYLVKECKTMVMKTTLMQKDTSKRGTKAFKILVKYNIKYLFKQINSKKEL